MFLKLSIAILAFNFYACSEYTYSTNADRKMDGLYAARAEERRVEFEAVYWTQATKVSQLQITSLQRDIESTTQFLFGPTTHRNLAGLQKGARIQPHLDRAYLQNNRVMIPYTYQGTWLIESSIAARGALKIPVPLSISDLKTAQWKNCTDSNDEHATWDFFWYYWDPQRYGCDHKPGKQYQEVSVVMGQMTEPTKSSYPEYQNLIRYKNGEPYLSMTFAFGYVEDVANPKPFTDFDYGMSEFQDFYRLTKKELLAKGFVEKPIYQKDITSGNIQIGVKFEGLVDGVHFEVSVIAAAGVDQMDIFTRSYAGKHDGFFGWFGHSRVGSGFDADVFARNLRFYPDEFSISSDYQLVYWAGCNSYSYYTLPFFALKAKAFPELDPQGTKKLDLISNGLPSLFDFNSYNAYVLLHALLNWDIPTSYQTIINRIEDNAKSKNYVVLVNVLGDEDNE